VDRKERRWRLWRESTFERSSALDFYKAFLLQEKKSRLSEGAKKPGMDLEGIWRGRGEGMGARSVTQFGEVADGAAANSHSRNATINKAARPGPPGHDKDRCAAVKAPRLGPLRLAPRTLRGMPCGASFRAD